MIQEFLSFLNENAGIVAVITIVGSAFKYFHLQTRESNQRQFEEYHALLKRLVAGEPNEPVWIDRQKAIIFELRNFPRYYPFTVRMLQDLEALWSQNKDRPVNDSLYLDPNHFLQMQREILLTTKFIQKRKIWLFCEHCKSEMI